MSTAAVALGAGSLFSGLFASANTNATNVSLAEQGNAFNEKMLEKQMKYNKEMYERQLSDTLAYSDPSFIAGRVRQAGYNPNVIAGSQLGSAASIPTTLGVTTPQANVPHVDYSGISDAVGQAGSFALMEQNVSSESDLRRAQEDGLRIENKYKGAMAIAKIADMYSTISDRDTRKQLDTVLKGLEADLRQESITQTQEQTNLIRMQVKAKALDNFASETKLNFLGQQLKISLANSVADLQLKRASESLTRKQIEAEVQSIAESVARTSLANTQASAQRGQNQLFNQTYQYRVQMVRNELLNLIYDTDKLGVGKTLMRGLESIGIDMTK